MWATKGDVDSLGDSVSVLDKGKRIWTIFLKGESNDTDHSSSI